MGGLLDTTVWLAALAGIALAAACGLRAFLPLLVLGLASRAGLIELHAGARWLSDDLALVTLGVATVIEILGDKIPVVDHVLDAIGTVLRPVAAWVAAYAAFSAWPSPWGQLAAVALGTVAVGVHVAKAKLRIGSTATTLGTANPVLSVAEDVMSLLLAALAVIAPIAIALALVAIVWIVSRLRRRPPASLGEPPMPMSPRP